MSLQDKINSNRWDDFFRDVLPILDRACRKPYDYSREDYWSWASNSYCKYIDVRIDMRDGGCIIRGRDGALRISPERLAWQYSKETPNPPANSVQEPYDYKTEAAAEMREELEAARKVVEAARHVVLPGETSSSHYHLNKALAEYDALTKETP